MDKKRIFMIVGFVVITLVLGFFVWRVFFRTPPTPGTVPGVTPGVEPGEPGSFPQSGTGEPGGEVTTPPSELPTAGVTGRQLVTPPLARIVQVSNDSVIGAFTDSNGNLQYYDQENGQFYRLRPDGSLELLSDEVFFNVDEVYWSPNSDEAVIEYPDGNNLYYNFQTKRQVTLPREWENFSFSDSGDKLAAKSIGFSPENRWLVTSNPDGSEPRLIEPLGDNADKVDVKWSPNNQIVATSLTGEPQGGDRQEVLFVGLNGENFKSTIVEGLGFTNTWSPQGDKLLYSVYSARSEFKPELWIVDAQPGSIGSGRRLLGVNTWADKCTFADSRFVYCGVPQNLGTGSGFAPQIADTLAHEIQRIDTQTGLTATIPLDNFHVIDSIFTDEASGDVFFTDKNQGGVFKVDI